MASPCSGKNLLIFNQTESRRQSQTPFALCSPPPDIFLAPDVTRCEILDRVPRARTFRAQAIASIQSSHSVSKPGPASEPLVLSHWDLAQGPLEFG